MRVVSDFVQQRGKLDEQALVRVEAVDILRLVEKMARKFRNLLRVRHVALEALSEQANALERAPADAAEALLAAFRNEALLDDGTEQVDLRRVCGLHAGQIH